MPYPHRKYNVLIILLFTVSITHSQPLFASLPNLTNKQAFQLTLTHDATHLNLQWQIAPDCYLYQNQLQINLKTPHFTTSLLPSPLPAAQIILDPILGSQAVYQDLLITLPLAFYLKKNTTLELEVTYQGCARTVCYPPTTAWFTIQSRDQQIHSVNARHATPSSSKPLFSVISFYLLGLLLAFTPCVLPMLPILCSVILGKALSTGKAFRLSCCYVLAMAFTYALAGMSVAMVGKNLQATLQKPVIITLFSLLFVYLGLAQLGKTPLHLPHRWRANLHRLHHRQMSGSYWGALMMGVLATLIASPCVSAPLIGALSYISQTGNLWLGASALFILALGMGTPLLIAGTLGAHYLPKQGKWMKVVNYSFALLMFGLSIWLLGRIIPGFLTLLLWGGLCFFCATLMGAFQRQGWISRLGLLVALYGALLFWGAWLKESDPLKPLFNPWHASRSTEKTIHSLSELKQQLARNHQPTLIVFYADWCSACKRLEQDLSSIKVLFPQWITIYADVTTFNEDARNLLKQYNLVGPPAIIFFDSNQGQTEARLVGEISRQQLVDHLHALSASLKE